MRITLLSWRDTTHPDGGGAERYLEEIARRLVRDGHEVTLFCAAHAGAATDEIVNGVHIRRRGGRLTVYLHGLGHLLGRTGRAQDVVVDVVNGVPFGAGLVRRRGVVVVVHHLHREQWHMIYPRFWGRVGWFVESRVVPRLYRRAPFITVSEATCADLVTLGIERDRITVVHNGVDGPAEAAPRSSTPRLVVLARLVPHKQIEHAMLVVRDLAEQFPEVHLDVLGDGWWHARLTRLCGDLGLGERVTFHGWVDSAKRDRLLSHGWLMLAPSVKEGWSIAVLEAAAVGTPTIAYRSAGGVRESIVDGVTGLLADDRAELVRLTARCLRDQDKREALGRAARDRAQLYKWDDAARAFGAVLNEVSARRTG